MAEAYIIDAVRTPRGSGKPGKGGLSHLHPQHLGATVLRALAERNRLDTADVGDVIWSTSAQKGKQGFDLARMSSLLAGYDVAASGVTLDRFCGGGITAVAFGAGQIMAGLDDLIVAGGTEMMSYIASTTHDEVQAGLPMYNQSGGNPELEAVHPQSHQGLCGDAVAAMEGFTREEIDAYALESQIRAARAIAQGHFARSIVPVRNSDGSLALDRDEHPRPGTTAASLADLQPSFGAIAGMVANAAGETYADLILRRYPGLDIVPIHHAGNSSGVVDGAAAVLLASPDYASRHDLKPRARIVAVANAGDCPTLMLNAPVPAARKVLAKAGMTKDQIDVFEVNEAFGVVPLKFIRDMGVDWAKVNPNGGAIALGHPIGATGAMLIGTALDELERTGQRYALITMCAAGGMAPAIIIERLETA